jgi:hypothetical protein
MSRGDSNRPIMLGCALVGVATYLVFVSLASAGTLVAVTCHGPTGGAVGARGWSVAPASGQYISYASGCANGWQGAFGLTMGPNPTAEYFNGNGDTMSYSVPAGMRINSYFLNLYAFGGPCSIQNSQCADGFGQVYVNHTGQSDPNYDYRNLGYGAASATVGASELSGVTSVTVGVSCDPGQNLAYPCPGSANPEAQALVAGGAFTLQDTTIPTVTNVSGSLIAGGTLSGTNAIAFTGSDSGGGVYGATVFVDGQQVAQETPAGSEGLCVNLTPASPTMTFASPQPCPAAESFSIPVNTGQFSPGQHHLQAFLIDAAGDRVSAYDGTITTSGPSVTEVSGGALSGARAHVTNGNPCAGAQLEVEINGHRGTPVIPFGHPVTVKGVLHCGAVAIRGAQVAVATVGAPASLAINSSVQSGPDGSFAYKIPAGANRSLRFSYTAYSDDPSPSATALAKIAVRPKLKLRIGPRATRNGHTISWTGTVAGGPYPPQGVGLQLEVREGRHWKMFGTVVAHHKGKFHYEYTFKSTTEPATYDFRVALPATGSSGYLYSYGASNAVNVHVRP